MLTFPLTLSLGLAFGLPASALCLSLSSHLGFSFLLLPPPFGFLLFLSVTLLCFGCNTRAGWPWLIRAIPGVSLEKTCGSALLPSASPLLVRLVALSVMSPRRRHSSLEYLSPVEFERRNRERAASPADTPSCRHARSRQGQALAGAQSARP